MFSFLQLWAKYTVCCSAELSALQYAQCFKTILGCTAIPYQTSLFRHKMYNASWKSLPIILHSLTEWHYIATYVMRRSFRILFKYSLGQHLHNLIYTFENCDTSYKIKNWCSWRKLWNMYACNSPQTLTTIPSSKTESVQLRYLVQAQHNFFQCQ